MLKNIIFDFGNVLIDYNPDKILDRYDINDQERAILKKNIFGSKEWLQIDAGKINEDEATELFKKKVPAELRPKIDKMMATWPERVTYFSEMLNFMKDLHQKGYHLFALSNTGMRFANYLMSTDYGKYFEGEVFSAAEKLMKPDPKIYQIMLNRYQLVPDECLFIDDRPENTETAQKLGMHVFTFNIKKLPELKEYINELK